MGKYFGTDGFRGRAGVDLLSTHAYKIGRFLGYYLKGEAKARAIIGKDTRLSSSLFEDAISSGLSSSGADVYKLGICTTPAVSYLSKSEGFDIGIMISASHNPYYDNGIKIIDSSGKKIDDEFISKIENYIDNEDFEKEFPFASGEKIGKIVDFSSELNKYVDFLYAASSVSLSGLKIGLDPSNGGGFDVCQAVFNRLGADVHIINNAPSGININEGCGSTHMEALCNFVKSRALDVGFAYDGDGDRCIAVDENGEEIDGDKIMYALAIDLKEENELKKDTVVTTVMSNGGLYKALSSHGISHVETKVGDRYVSEEMVRGGYSLGGEQSGHIIISKYLETGDGILTSIKLAELIKKKKRKLSSLTKEVKPFPQILKNVHVVDKNAILGSISVQKAKKEAEQLLKNGRVLLRPSGTEPLIRIMVEGEDKNECESVANMLENTIKSVKGEEKRDEN